MFQKQQFVIVSNLFKLLNNWQKKKRRIRKAPLLNFTQQRRIGNGGVTPGTPNLHTTEVCEPFGNGFFFSNFSTPVFKM